MLLLLMFPIALLNADDSVQRLFSSLFAPYNSLCYIQAPSRFLDGFLRHIKQPLYVQAYQQLQANRLANETLHCDSYLLDSSNFSHVIQHLESGRNNYLIRPHSTMWLIQKQLEVEGLPDLFQPYAINLLVIQVDEKQLLIYSASRKVVLFQAERGRRFAPPDSAWLAAARWQAGELFAFKQRPLRISVFNCKPFMEVEEGVAKGVEMLWIHELIRDIPRVLLAVPSSENPWKFLIGSVQARESDLAGCSQYALNLLKWNVDAILSHVQACYTFLVPKARYLPEVTFLGQAFSWQVWIWCLATLAALACLGERLQLWNSLELAAINVLKVCASGAATCRPLRASKRLFLISLLIYGLLFDTYYTAGSSSILTKPRVVRVINTFQDMVQFQVTYQLQSPTIQSDFRSLNSSTFSALAALYRQGERRKTVLDGSSALTVKNIGNIYVTDVGEFPQDRLRHYRVIKQCISNNYIGLAVMKNSPLTRVFNDVSQRLTESGLIVKWLKDEIYWERESQLEFFEVSESEREYGRISSGKLAGALVVLLAGLLLAGLSFALEVCCQRRQ